MACKIVSGQWAGVTSGVVSDYTPRHLRHAGAHTGTEATGAKIATERRKDLHFLYSDWKIRLLPSSARMRSEQQQ